MRRAKFFALFLIACTTFAAEAPRKIAFERESNIWVADLDGSGAKRLTAGAFPSISPDGARVALNTDEKKGNSFARRIAVVTIGSGDTTVFTCVPSDNSYYPVFSPDGSQIVFTLYDGSLWHLGLINSDGTGFHYLKKSVKDGPTLYSPCWAPDGKSIFCQDMSKIVSLGIDGVVLDQWEIQKLIPNGDMSSAGRIDVSPDGKRLLLSVDMGEEAHRKDWDGPLPAVWILDLAAKKSQRVTPRHLFGWDGIWVDNDTILFASQAAGEKQASLYRMLLGAKERKLVIKTARMTTISQ